MKRLSLIAVAVLAMATAAGAQTVERMVDAAKLFPMLDKFQAIAPADRSELALSYLVLQDGKPNRDLRLTLVTGGRRKPLPIDDTGRLERLPDPQDFADHAQVAVQAPKGSKLTARLDLSTSIKPAQEISAADCALALVQANAAIHKAVGVMAMLVPRISKVIFPGSGSGVAVGADGKQQPLPLVNGQPAYDPDTLKGAKLLRLAKPPSRVDIE